MLEQQKKTIDMKQNQLRQLRFQKQKRQEEEAAQRKERQKIFRLRQKQRELEEQELRELEKLHVNEKSSLPKVKSTPVLVRKMSKSSILRLSKAREPPKPVVVVETIKKKKKIKKTKKRAVIKKLNPLPSTNDKRETWTKPKHIKPLEAAIQPNKWYEALQEELGFKEDVREEKAERVVEPSSNLPRLDNQQDQQLHDDPPMPAMANHSVIETPNPEQKYTPEYLQKLLAKYDMPTAPVVSPMDSKIDSLCRRYT